MGENLLKVQGLKKYFPITTGILRKEVAINKAVDGVSFTLRKREVLGIVGESGSGKSTTGKAAIRLIEPTAGEITYKGCNLLTLSTKELKEIRKEIQIVFQDPFASLNPRKSILDAIGEALLYHRIVSTRQEQVEKVAQILHVVGLEQESMNRYPHEFSGGQQQRICIGRALALGPRVIVCDEAVSALDVSVRSQILNLLSQLKEDYKLSYLFITHDISVVRHFCDRVLVMYLGKVMEEAPVEALFTNPKHPYTQALLSAIPKQHPHDKQERRVLKGEIPSSISPPSGCPFRTRCPFAQPECALSIPRKEVGDNHHYFCIL